MRAVSAPLLLASFFFSATQSQAAAPDLPEGTTVLVQYYSQLGPGWPIGTVEFTREGWTIDLSSESSYAISFPTGAWSLHVSKRPYSHLSRLVEGGPT
jgi:hypothetical protein